MPQMSNAFLSCSLFAEILFFLAIQTIIKKRDRRSFTPLKGGYSINRVERPADVLSSSHLSFPFSHAGKSWTLKTAIARLITGLI